MSNDFMTPIGLLLMGIIAILLIILIVAVRKITSQLTVFLEKQEKQDAAKSLPPVSESTEVSEEEIAAVLSVISQLVPKERQASVRLRLIK